MISIERGVTSIRFWGQVLLALALFVKLLQFFIFGSTAVLGEWVGNSSAEMILVRWGMPLVNGGLFMAFAGWLPFTRREIYFLLIIGMLVASSLLVFGEGDYVYYTAHLIAALPLGYFLFCKALVEVLKARVSVEVLPHWVSVFFWLSIGLTSLGVATGTMLKLSVVFFPTTHDIYLYKLEPAFFNGAVWAAQFYLSGPEWLSSITKFIYSILGVLFLPLLAWLYREEKARSLRGWSFMLIPFFVAWFCYSWLPVSGPAYLFFSEGYPYGIPSPQDIHSSLIAVVSSPRNAMPSMHLSGAIFILMMAAALKRKFVFYLSIPFVLLTAWATLALGEHYVIDLVVALSFAPVLGLILMRAPGWLQAPRWAHFLHWAAGASFLLWMFLLRIAPEWLYANLGFVQLFSIWSVLSGFVLLILHVRCVWCECNTNERLLQKNAPASLPKPFSPLAILPVELTGKRWLVGVFFFSGFAGLLYEVVYAKALGVTFGGTALAANTVLMTYMGGMALGAWLGGILAERAKKPLYLYAVFEAVIGLYAVITPFLFFGILKLYVFLSLDSPPDAAWLTALRMILGAAVLGVPTVLMGATIPLVFQCLRSMGIPTARAIAPLYGANVLGAAVGALVAGYVVMPALGRNGATLLAAMISLMVALYVIDKIKNLESHFSGGIVGGNGASISSGSHLLFVKGSPTNRQGAAALVVLTLGGVVTLALEVVFMHLLAIVAGNSVYAFGLMLATFLAGLGFGSAAGEVILRRCGRLELVKWAQCGIALAILVTAFVWDSLAGYMASFGYAQEQGLYLSFSARELVRAMVCALAMLPPAFFVGMSYPAAMGVAADWLAVARFNGQAARGVGLASALNTLGNITGVLLAGFWWLPFYGSRDVLLGLAVTAVILAGLIAWADAKKMRRKAVIFWLPVGIIGASLVFFPTKWNYTALSEGGNVYFFPQQWGEVIDHAESVEGGLTTVARNGQSHLTLLTNGKFQGNNAEGGEMVAQESFALIPLMHTAQRDHALIIGYGTGMTARVLREQGFDALDVVELSRDIVTMADKHFSNINANVSSDPKVTMHYTDGRNYLLTQTQKYDIVSLEISSIWFSGAANLYNREFYELANNRLSDFGVLQQWVQLHHMRPLDFLYVMGSVRSVFRYVWVYVSGGQGIIVASNNEVAVDNELAMNELLRGNTISNIKLSELPKAIVAKPPQVDAFLARFDPGLNYFLSTDENLYLEYATPKGNAMREDSMPIIISLLKGE